MSCSSSRMEPAAGGDVVREQVRERYGKLAMAPGEGGSCCGTAPRDKTSLAKAIGYDEASLESIPDGSNLGLSCGNPTALASLAPGEVVVDLGSGAGFDAFQAATQVGASGRVIGVDMTPEMVNRARGGAAAFARKSGLSNVEFHLGEIEHLPIPNAVADVVISNCVINLSPDKPQVFREIFRVLRPGGRVAVSDIALLTSLPDALRENVEAFVGCVAGAAPVDEIRTMLTDAGFHQIALTPKPGSLRAMLTPDDPLHAQIVSSLPPGRTLDTLVTSLDISAHKP